MPRRTKVVPIEEEKYRLIAMDKRAQRIIFGIGGQRFAIDLLSRVSLLAPVTVPGTNYDVGTSPYSDAASDFS